MSVALQKDIMLCHIESLDSLRMFWASSIQPRFIQFSFEVFDSIIFARGFVIYFALFF